jgi:hypothetical protein
MKTCTKDSSKRGKRGKVANKFSYDVEKDYWDWEAAAGDQKRLRQMLEQLP